MEPAHKFEIQEQTYYAKWCNNPQHQHLSNTNHESLKTYTTAIYTQQLIGSVMINNVKYSAFGKLLCTYNTKSSIERIIVSKNWIKLHTLPVLHFNCCLTTEYSETTTHFNGNFDTDNRIYIL
jgi:hypothetical protein